MMKDIEYGHIRIKLKEYMEQYNISINRLANRAEMQRKQVKKFMRQEVQRIDLCVMSRICYALDCRIEDLLVYDPYEETPISTEPQTPCIPSGSDDSK